MFITPAIPAKVGEFALSSAAAGRIAGVVSRELMIRDQ
jgi:hypothetical protein